jgi:acetyltransferase-like isoleucine patch superfamily enzyme
MGNSKKEEYIRIIGLKGYIHSIIFNRILRINSDIPWPTHHSSVISFPDRIDKKGVRPILGIAPGCYINAKNGIIIGKNTRVGPGVKNISTNHDILNLDNHKESEPIEIGESCWIGANSVILPGVKLLNHTIVGAGSVVTKIFHDKNIVIAGVPAIKIRDIEPHNDLGSI